MNGDPLWYKDAIIYELHVRAFFDSDGDGSGDFRGLTEKLDYLEELGVTALWLLPFYPSPLRDDGYDIADYTGIHPMYGNLADFKRLLKEAHRRGMRVITELVLNHTSDQHPWFQRARHAPAGSVERDFYVWSDTPDKYSEARIIFKDFEASNWAWDRVANAYYWHRFYTQQPDLNFEQPAVHDALFQVLDFWLGLGVDGMRLDAVPYLYEREGTGCEGLPETHEFLRKMRDYVDQRYPGRMFLGEANQWPEETAKFFGQGDECQMNFHFPVMPRLYLALRMEDRAPVVDILRQTPPIPQNCQWAMFLRNHDELTLETVTEEDRDFLWRAYASDPQARINLGIRRRLAPLMGHNRRRIELMNALLFSLPGTPVLYYGDEIGMGDNIYLGDRNGVRTPMQWSADRNAGFSRANPQRLYLPIIIDPEYHYEAVNVDAQQRNPASLLNWTRRMIALRKRHKAFGRGSLEFLYPENPSVLAFLRTYEDETILVVVNLSRFVQFAELDLAAFRDSVPVEMLGQTRFPAIGDRPYFLSMGPHSFYWFALQRPGTEVVAPKSRALDGLPVLQVSSGWQNLFDSRHTRRELERALAAYLPHSGWFRGRRKPFSTLRLAEAIQVPTRQGHLWLVLARVGFTQDEHETVLLALGQRTAVQSQAQSDEIAWLRGDGEESRLYEATTDPAFAEALIAAIAGRQRLRGAVGRLVASATAPFRGRLQNGAAGVPPVIDTSEPGVTSIRFPGAWRLKLYRRLETAVHPDLEIGRFLTEKTTFSHAPVVAGVLQWWPGRRAGNPNKLLSLGALELDAPRQQDAWVYFLDLARTEAGREASVEAAQLLGRRTAGLHLALASRPEESDFASEEIPPTYQRSLVHAVRSLAFKVFEPMRRFTTRQPQRVQVLEEALAARLDEFLRHRMVFERIRVHGDYDLRHVRWVEGDFVLAGFGGDVSRSVGERRLKRSALRDVAGLLGSFEALAASISEPWASAWAAKMFAQFLDAYLEEADGASFLPPSRDEVESLLVVHLLEASLTEVRRQQEEQPGLDIASLPGFVALERILLGSNPG